MRIIRALLLKGVVDTRTVFSPLELAGFSFLCDHPSMAFDSGNMEAKEVDTKTLIPIQNTVDGTSVDNYDPIMVAERGGKLYIIDGHHRYARNLKQKRPSEVLILHMPDRKVNLTWFEQVLGRKLQYRGGLVTFAR